MFKLLKILIVIIFLFQANTYAHVQHYENLKRIKFDIYRNDTHIGQHIFSFTKNDDELTVYSKINFEIKKIGIVLYTYEVKGTEVYKDGKLIKFNSKTNQNGKEKYVNLKLENKKLVIDGSSTDKKLAKDKKLNTDVWYDEETLNWVKATFKKKGRWEYRLVLIE